jgi:DnaK suppressor protein
MNAPKKLDPETVKKLEIRLLERLKELDAELDEDMDTFQEQLPADSEEAAPMLDDLDIVEADHERDADETEDIRTAIRNIHSGDYGKCGTCSQPIAVERLLAMPHVLLCIRCQTAEENQDKA